MCPPFEEWEGCLELPAGRSPIVLGVLYRIVLSGGKTNGTALVPSLQATTGAHQKQEPACRRLFEFRLDSKGHYRLLAAAGAVSCWAVMRALLFWAIVFLALSANSFALGSRSSAFCTSGSVSVWTFRPSC